MCNQHLRLGRPHRRAQHPDRFSDNDRVERRGELCDPIAEQEPKAAEAAGWLHEQVAGLLCHPRSDWMGCDTEHVDSAGGHLDHEQDIQPL